MRKKAHFGNGAPFGGAEGKWGPDWKVGSRFVGALQEQETRMRGMGQVAGGGLKDGRRPRCGAGARTGVAEVGKGPSAGRMGPLAGLGPAGWWGRRPLEQIWGG